MAILFIVMAKPNPEYCFNFVFGESERNMVVTFGGIFSLKPGFNDEGFWFYIVCMICFDLVLCWFVCFFRFLEGIGQCWIT